LRLAERDLKTAKELFNDENYDWSLVIAYNAILQAGRAIMFKTGYGLSSSYGHLGVVRFLHAVMGEISKRLVTFIDRARRKRHRVVYEEVGSVSHSEAEKCLKWAKEFAEKRKTL